MSRIKKHLHVVLCMDPGHPKFLYRCESNPALYAQCSVLWIGEWRSSSLKTIPLLMDGIKDLLGGREEGREEEEEEVASSGKRPDRGDSKSNRGDRGKRAESKDGGGAASSRDKAAPVSGLEDGGALIEMLLAIHTSCVTQGNATPKDFIAFLRMWHSLFNMKRQELVRDVGHLEAGLSKLESAAEIVNDLRTNAAQQVDK